MIGWERIQGGKANLKRWVLSFERNVETNNELRVSGGREFQSLGAMTEKALLPREIGGTERGASVWNITRLNLVLYLYETTGW